MKKAARNISKKANAGKKKRGGRKSSASSSINDAKRLISKPLPATPTSASPSKSSFFSSSVPDGSVFAYLTLLCIGIGVFNGFIHMSAFFTGHNFSQFPASYVLGYRHSIQDKGLPNAIIIFHVFAAVILQIPLIPQILSSVKMAIEKQNKEKRSGGPLLSYATKVHRYFGNSVAMVWTAIAITGFMYLATTKKLDQDPLKAGAPAPPTRRLFVSLGTLFNAAGTVSNLAIGIWSIWQAKKMKPGVKKQETTLIHEACMAFMLFWIYSSATTQNIMWIAQMAMRHCFLGVPVEFGIMIASQTVQLVFILACLHMHDKRLLKHSTVVLNLGAFAVLTVATGVIFGGLSMAGNFDMSGTCLDHFLAVEETAQTINSSAVPF